MADVLAMPSTRLTMILGATAAFLGLAVLGAHDLGCRDVSVIPEKAALGINDVHLFFFSRHHISQRGQP